MKNPFSIQKKTGLISKDFLCRNRHKTKKVMERKNRKNQK